MLRWGEFPGDPVIRTHAFTSKDTGLIPGQRRKIPPALPHSQKKKKKKLKKVKIGAKRKITLGSWQVDLHRFK